MGYKIKKINSVEKKCSCPLDFWEVIIVDKDENFNNISTVYYHCDYCGEDFIIRDLETSEVLYERC